MTREEIIEAGDALGIAIDPDLFIEDGVLSDSPDFVFNFGDALSALKRGELVRRRGWNGKGMFLWLKTASTIKAEWCKDPILKKVVQENGGEMTACGTICMKTADNKIVTGWVPSQVDMLSEDWEVFNNEIFEWEKSLTADDFVDYGDVIECNENAADKMDRLNDYIENKLESAETAEDIKSLREKLSIPEFPNNANSATPLNTANTTENLFEEFE